MYDCIMCLLLFMFLCTDQWFGRFVSKTSLWSQVIGRRIYGTLRHCWNGTPRDNLDDSAADLLILHFGWICFMGRPKIQNPPGPKPSIYHLFDMAAIILHIQFSYASNSLALKLWSFTKPTTLMQNMSFRIVDRAVLKLIEFRQKVGTG